MNGMVGCCHLSLKKEESKRNYTCGPTRVYQLKYTVPRIPRRPVGIQFHTSPQTPDTHSSREKPFDALTLRSDIRGEEKLIEGLGERARRGERGQEHGEGRKKGNIFSPSH